MEYVKQTDKTGCLCASLAMATGKGEEEYQRLRVMGLLGGDGKGRQEASARIAGYRGMAMAMAKQGFFPVGQKDAEEIPTEGRGVLLLGNSDKPARHAVAYENGLIFDSAEDGEWTINGVTPEEYFRGNPDWFIEAIVPEEKLTED